MHDWIFCPKKPVRVEPVHVKYKEQKMLVAPGYPEITIPEHEYDDNYTAIGNDNQRILDIT